MTMGSKVHVSVLPVSFFGALENGSMSISEWAAMAHRLNIRYIDLPSWVFSQRTPVSISYARQILSSYNIRISMIGTYSDFTNPDKTQRKRELDYLFSDIALASEIGAQYIRLTDGQAHPGLNTDTAISWITENFIKAAEKANEYGIVLAFENHGHPSAWIYDDFSHSSSLFMKVAEAIRSTGVKINFDTGNASGCGMDAISMLDSLYDEVRSLHIAETVSNVTTVHAALGAGIVPIEGILRFLSSRNYRGNISIEEDSGKGEMGIFQSYRFVTGILTNLGVEWE